MHNKIRRKHIEESKWCAKKDCVVESVVECHQIKITLNH